MSSTWHYLNLSSVQQVIKKFPAFYRIQGLITILMRAYHSSYPEPDHSIPFHHILFRSVLMLSCHQYLHLRNGLFPSGFPIKILDAFLLFPMRATYPTPSHPPCLDHPDNTWWGVQIMKLLTMLFSQVCCCFLSLRSKYSPSS